MLYGLQAGEWADREGTAFRKNGRNSFAEYQNFCALIISQEFCTVSHEKRSKFLYGYQNFRRNITSREISGPALFTSYTEFYTDP